MTITLTRDEAQQVLDALDSDNPDIQLRAATNLRAALAQPEQEPVAWVYEYGLQREKGKIEWHRSVNFGDPSKFPPVRNVQPLYTAPPQRDWQNLTDDELDDIDHRAYSQTVEKGLPMADYCLQLARAVEAKLRAKNA